MPQFPRSLKILCLLILSMVAVHYLFFRAPSEAQMIAHFHQHRAEFEQLRTMLPQDKKVMTIAPDWLRTRDWDFPKNPEDAGISKQRLVRYRSMMTKLELALIGGDADYAQFDVFGGGFADTTWSIGYARSRQPPQSLVKSAYWHKRIMRGSRVHSHIEGHWYIYHRR